MVVQNSTPFQANSKSRNMQFGHDHEKVYNSVKNSETAQKSFDSLPEIQPPARKKVYPLSKSVLGNYPFIEKVQRH